MLPTVYHYSWFDIERKITSYKTHWGKFWKSMYNLETEDTGENNMCFDKPWSEVSDNDIDNLSNKLRDSMGGWIFHSKVDFSNPTPHLSLSRNQPKVMLENE